MDHYDDAYRVDAALFGAEPEPLLLEHLEQLDRSKPVLDIGAGQGRHTLPLARAGWRVEALDPSQVALDAIGLSAAAEGLALTLRRGLFEDFEARRGPYGAVLAFGLIPDLPRETIELLARRAAGWAAGGGLVFATAFTTDDDAYPRIRDAHEELARGSFALPGDRVRTYLDPGELPQLFPGLEVVTFREELGPEHRHGGSAPERHAMAQAVLRAT